MRKALTDKDAGTEERLAQLTSFYGVALDLRRCPDESAMDFAKRMIDAVDGWAK